jgi:N-methylhydantoinase B
MLMQNDPYSGNNHLPDFMLAEPVYVDGELLGISSVRGHWLDVGGSMPSSYVIDATEIIEEGLRVPPVKFYEGGERNEHVLEIVLSNVRDREERLGDLNAQLAGVRRGKERLQELADEYGAETIATAMETILSNEEQRMRTRIAELPDGSFSAEDYMDSDRRDSERLTIRATLTVDGDEMTIDFDGTDPQVDGAINAPYSGTITAAYYGVKVTLDPGSPGTMGVYRPIEVTAPSGTLVNPDYPAPVAAGNHETTNRIYDTVVRAITEIDPELAFAAGDGSSNVFNWQSADSGQINFTCQPGAIGACPTHDGIDAIRSGVGNTGVQPIERLEDEYDFMTVEEFHIVEDGGGAGRYRGGNGTRRIIRTEDETEVILAAERATTNPFGIAGGQPGSSSRHVVHLPDGEQRDLPSKTNETVPPGSAIEFQTASGGGYGDPMERPPEAVREDVENGYVSVEAAREVYGVVIDPETITVDEDATADRRNGTDNN